MQVSLVSITQPVIEGLLGPEDLISYIARVSNPSNQMNTETAPRLLKYLIKHKHWSPFEQVSVTFEIETSRAIAAQILRHRSFCFQEFSQRYSEAFNLESFNIRKQAEKNRQSSADILDLPEEETKQLKDYLINGINLYKGLLEKGAAKECARMILPLCTQTTIYMTGNLRSWITYVDLRSQEDTQLEHREIAIAIKDILIDIFPNVSEALEWKKTIDNSTI
ncbi:FAD-dependent thymidylate synthase [bacterium]|nr:FAD-dependent thymidylate synthase [bacterium]